MENYMRRKETDKETLLFEQDQLKYFSKTQKGEYYVDKYNVEKYHGMRRKGLIRIYAMEYEGFGNYKMVWKITLKGLFRSFIYEKSRPKDTLSTP